MRLLEYMVEQDGLTNQHLRIFRKKRGNAIANLYETKEAWQARKSTFISPPMTLAERRNRAADGDPFDTVSSAGLIELVRDLIEYAYRSFIEERLSANNAFWPIRS